MMARHSGFNSSGAQGITVVRVAPE